MARRPHRPALSAELRSDSASNADGLDACRFRHARLVLQSFRALRRRPAATGQPGVPHPRLSRSRPNPASVPSTASRARASALDDPRGAL
jgi:hypothetical protein